MTEISTPSAVHAITEIMENDPVSHGEVITSAICWIFTTLSPFGPVAREHFELPQKECYPFISALMKAYNLVSSNFSLPASIEEVAMRWLGENENIIKSAIKKG